MMSTGRSVSWLRSRGMVWLLVLGCASAAAGAEGLPDPQLLRPVLLHEDAQWQVFARCPTRKVLPGEDLGASEGLLRADALELAVARNESEQVSLVLRPRTNLQGVTVSFSDLKGPGVIPSTAWSWRRVGAVQVDQASLWYGVGGWETGMIPDPLLPAGPFDAPESTNSTLLLEVGVPADAQPGEYLGQLTLQAQGCAPTILSVKLTVWDITLPSEPTLDTMACGAGIGDLDLCKLLRDTGVTTLKYGSTRVGRSLDPETGQLNLDTTQYSKDLATLIDDLGFRSVCLPPSLLGQQNTLAKSYLGLGKPVGSEAFWPLHEQFLTGMGDFYRANGWADNVLYYMMDEIRPELHPFAAQAGRAAQRCFPEMPTALTTDEVPDKLAGALDIWCSPWHFFVTQPEDVARWDELRERGLTLWAYMNSLYTLNADWNPGAMRIFPTVLAKYGYEGALWWHIAYFKGQNPWDKGIITLENTKKKQRHYANGYLVYPPREGEKQWHSSLRWENYSQGLDEYEFMMQLRERWVTVQRSLGAPAQDPAFSADQAMRWWGALLATEFRVQTFRKDTPYVHRFRQLIAHEITGLLNPPLALVDCEPGTPSAMTSDTLHVRGVCAAGTQVTVAGEETGESSRDAPFVFEGNVRLTPGRNLIPITFTGPKGHTKTLYREVTYTPEPGE